ncbi:MAG: COX15/CtaA family protein [Acidobacteria bacterium]|nr:COX15/CtaA family protein [Acidobacteriota bacterium]
MSATVSVAPGCDRGSALAIGFAMTVGMWAIGYAARLPSAVSPGARAVPGWIVFAVFVICLLGGGVFAGRRAHRGWLTGLSAGAVSSTLNLLVLGSVLGGELRGSGTVWWVPVSIVLGAALSGAGALAGGVSRPRPAPDVNWTFVFATVASIATFFLLIVGGLVTSEKAGLAVVDWPNTFGHNMFLYPLSRMTGGIYFEHAHRLFGSLVGLTTLVLCLHLFRIGEQRRWLKRFALLALAIVIIQGILGGLRVTGRFTLSTSQADTAPSIALAIVHGVMAQLFFGMMVAISAFTSTAWKATHTGHRSVAVSTDTKLGAAAVGLLIIQLVLGAIQRHLARGLLIHISLAAVVAFLVLAVALRAWGLRSEIHILNRLGKVVMGVVAAQLLLGFCALVVTGAMSGSPQPPLITVLITTAHQATGAVLLALTILLSLWSHRFAPTLPEP